MKELRPYKKLFLKKSNIDFDRNFFQEALSEIPNISIELTGNNHSLQQIKTDLEEEESDCKSQYCCHYHLYSRDYKKNDPTENIFTLVRFWKEMGFTVRYQLNKDILKVHAV